LGERCQNTLLEILELLILAYAKSTPSKRLILGKADTQLKVLQYLVRVCYDVKAINKKQYLVLQALLQEIGKMLGGWIKSIQQTSQ
jgi:hypothetical protein